MLAGWRVPVVVFILALCVGWSLPVAAEEAADGYITGESATWVTLVEQSSCSVEEVQPLADGVVQRVRDARMTCDVRFDDPRVSGTVTTTGNYDCNAEAGCITWGQQRIDGPDGDWSGTFSGLIDPAFTERAIAVLTGSGSYEGLTLVLHGIGPLEGEPTAVGLVYEGNPPTAGEIDAVDGNGPEGDAS